jgi:hypothetical protein
MFPNVRLLVVAVLAAIAGIACGLGLFATFRVNHEPLARFAEGGPPLQLAFDKLAPMPDTAAPVAARYPLSGAAKPLSAPVLVPPPNSAPDSAEAGSAPGEGAANAEYSAGTAAPADQRDETSVAVITPGEQSTGAAENIETGQHAADVVAPGEQEPDKSPPPTESAASTAIEAAADSGATDTTAELLRLQSRQLRKPKRARSTSPSRRPKRRVRRNQHAARPRRFASGERQPQWRRGQPMYGLSRPTNGPTPPRRRKPYGAS